MIRAVFIINDSGQPRLVRWYENVPDSERAGLMRRVFLSVSRRGDRLCNFLDVAWDDRLLPGADRWIRGTKLVYRHYATLYFIFVCEETESELGILDLIQVFVETLECCFESVCELDIVFSAERVNFVLDEIIQGGVVLETNMASVLKAIDEQASLERATAEPPSSASLVTSGAATVTSLAATATSTALDRAQSWWRSGASGLR